MQRTTTLGTKLIAGVTLLAFGTIACTQQATTTETREVTVETWRAGDDQPPQLWSSSEVPLDQITFARKVIVDGVPSTVGLGKIPAGTTFDVPLNNGETATLRKTADRVELVSFTGPTTTEANAPRGTVKAVQIQDGGFALYYADSPNKTADILMKVPGIDKLGATEREAILDGLALQTLLFSLEDVEQAGGVVAIAILVGLVSAAWLWICYDTAKSCADRCEYAWGFESSCGGLTITWGDSLGIELGGLYSCRCYDY